MWNPLSPDEPAQKRRLVPICVAGGLTVATCSAHFEAQLSPHQRHRKNEKNNAAGDCFAMPKMDASHCRNSMPGTAIEWPPPPWGGIPWMWGFIEFGDWGFREGKMNYKFPMNKTLS
jgi:hypothetical protein